MRTDLPDSSESAFRRRRGIRSTVLRTATGLTTLALLIGAGVTSASAAVFDETSTPVDEGTEEIEGGTRPTTDVAVDTNGNQWVAWVQTNDTTNTYTPKADYTLQVAERSADGEWGAPDAVTTFERPAGKNYPRIISVDIELDGDGLPTVAWNEVQPDADSAGGADGVEILASSLGSSGWTEPAVLGSGALTVSPLPFNGLPLALDIDSDGTAAVAWQTEDGTATAVRTAGTWGAAVVHETTEGAALAPVGVGIDGRGAVTVAWRSENLEDGTFAIKARTSNTSGSFSSAAVTVASGLAQVSRPTLALDLSGAAVVTWGSEDGSRAAVRASGASTWSEPVALSTGSANAAPANEQILQAGMNIPSVGFDAYGTATVVWPEHDPAGRVAVATVDQAGTWSETETLAATTGSYFARAPRVVAGLDGSATAVWTSAVVVSGGLTGAEVFAATRDADGVWSTPVKYTQPNNGSFGTVTALGFDDRANAALTADPLGNALIAWAPYANAMGQPGTSPVRTVAAAADVDGGLSWTARDLAGSSDLRSWVNYVRTDWATAGECVKDVHDVVVSGEATKPSAADPYSWRFALEDAWIDEATGKTIVQYSGTLGFVMDAHCIDIEFTDPRLEISADGETVRVYADGQASGDMGSTIGGEVPEPTPVTNVRLLDLSLAGIDPVVDADGDTQSLVNVPATFTAAAASAFSLPNYSSRPFGDLTLSFPTELATRGEVVLDSSTPTMQARIIKVGATVTAVPGEWTEGTEFSYQWFAHGYAISGATSKTYKVPAKYAGKLLSVRVTGSLSGYESVSVTSEQSRINRGTLTGTVPTISGTAKVGKTLTASRGKWSSGASFKYQWYANGKALSGKTSSTLKLTSSTRGKKITVRVTATLTGYAPLWKTSAATATVK